MLNRHNLDIASLCSKEESRYSLCGILVTKERTCVTDGHLLVTVTTPDIPPDNIPIIEGINPSEDPIPFIMPADQALSISKAIPKRSLIPVITNAFVESGEGDSAKVAVTDLESPRIFNCKKIPGIFPKFDQVIPSPDSAEIAIAVDANLMINVLKSLGSVSAATKEKLASVILRISDPCAPIRFDAENKDTGQKAVGVLMPLADKASTHSVSPRELVVEIEDGKVKNIYCDKDVKVTVVSRKYEAAKDKTVFSSCQEWKGKKDISERSSMPAALKKYISKQAEPTTKEEIEPAAEAAPAVAVPETEKLEAVPNYPSWQAAAEANASPKIGSSVQPEAAEPTAPEAPARSDTKASHKAPKAAKAPEAPPTAKASNGWDNPEVRAKRIAAIRAARAGKAA
jgi:hypothetical protein